MKRKFLLPISLAVVAGIMLSASFRGYASGIDKGLENAIKIARTKFAIPENFKFSSSISETGGKRIYHLSWSGGDAFDSVIIDVGMDAGGMVTNYNKYTQGGHKTAKKLPKLGRQEAGAMAAKYIEMIAPGLTRELRQEAASPGSIADSRYYFNYCRIINGIPFYNDRVYVNINRDNGELLSYSRQWTDFESIPGPAGAMPLEEAEAAYMKNLGIRLVYKSVEKEGRLDAYLAYVPEYENSIFGMDAFTGQKRRISGSYGRMAADEIMYMKAKVTTASGSVDGVRLSPEETEAVREASMLISAEEAEKIARNAEFLGISDSFELKNYYLNKCWPEKNSYAWSLSFGRKPDDPDGYEDYAAVTVNARTGEITNFYRRVPDEKPVKEGKNLAEAKAEADRFLSRYFPKYYGMMEYDKVAEELNNAGKLPGAGYTFIYSRAVNGIPFPDNGANIYYDGANGIIASFDLKWHDMKFPAEKVLGDEIAGRKLFENVGLELQYKLDFARESDSISLPGTAEKPAVVLVYAFKPGKPLAVGANSGKLLNGDGTEYKEPAAAIYTDIKGNAAEKQITALAENGICLEGAKFNPDSLITQLDFLTLLSKTMDYYKLAIASGTTERDIERFYNYLAREGIIRKAEIAPNEPVTREEAVKYLVRALKYDKVADIKGIFQVGYRDKSSISPGMEGYVAIAAGLGIVDGKRAFFKPEEKITRGESAILIYNYLQ